LEKVQTIWKHREELLRIQEILNREDIWWITFQINKAYDILDWLKIHKDHQVVPFDEYGVEHEIG